MQEHPTQLEHAIVRTICWFAVFEYPVTGFEIWKWLLEPDRPYDLTQVYLVLETSTWLHERVVMTQGFYVLSQHVDSERWLVQRRDRFLDATRKFKKLRRACSYFSMLPGVRTVCAVNTLAWWHTSALSDIDLFIITRPGLIWTSRFFLVAPFALLNRRPAKHLSQPVRDPFCFSFFVTQTDLQLESLKYNTNDYYLAFWTKSLVPFFDKDQHLASFEHVNKWASALLPNARLRSQHHTHKSKRPFRLSVQPRMLEGVYRSIQKRRMPSELVELANRDTRVVVSDTMLKFHENDRRELFTQKFEALVRETV